MSDNEKDKTDLERTEELFQFLQGVVPDGYQIRSGHVPKLTANKAWTAIWYIQNQNWKFPDKIDRCCVCGDLYDSCSEGTVLDYGKAPYHFCDSCMEGEKYEKKVAAKSVTW